MFLSVGEVANLLRLSEKTIYRLIWRKKLAGAFKLGGVWFIDKEILLNDLKAKAKH